MFRTMSRPPQIPSSKTVETLRQVADELTDGIWSTDSEGCFTYVNAALSEMLGTSKGDLIGRPIFDFVVDEDRALSMSLFDRSKRGVEEKIEFRLRTLDGAAVWVKVKTKPFQDDNDKFAGIHGVVRQLAISGDAPDS